MAELSFPTKDPDVAWTLDEALMSALLETFPSLDVEAEVRKAHLWCLVNHAKRKTARGMPKFLNAWLARASTERALGRTIRRHGDIPHGPRSQDVWQRAAEYARRRTGA